MKWVYLKYQYISNMAMYQIMFCFCRMSPVEESAKVVATLRQCTLARSQLEEAIGGVVKAEAQLKDNSREVRDPRPCGQGVCS